MGDLGGPYDVIVIGSGMSGLASANILAKEGMKVLLVEQHYRYGGYMQQFMLHRTPFDSGCHYIGAMGEGQVFDRYLRYLGVRDDIVAVPLNPDGFDVIQTPDRRFAIPVGHDAFIRSLSAEFPAQAGPIEAFVREIQAEVARFPMYSLSKTGDPRGGTPDPNRTVADVLTACGITDPGLIDILVAHNLLYFVEPHECPFTLHCFVTDSYLQGAYSVDGGGHAMVRALLKKFRAAGGVTLRRTQVTRLDVKDRTVRGIWTGDGRYEEAKTVIGCIDPKVMLAMLPDDCVRPAYKNRITAMKPGLGGMAAFLRVDADLSRFAGANYFLFGEDGPSGVFNDRWIDDEAVDPPVYVTIPSTRESSWRGPASVVVLTGIGMKTWEPWRGSKTGDRDDGYEETKQRVGERLLKPAQALIPELADHLVTADYGSPLTHRDYTLNSGGAIYGLHHSVDQSGVRGVSWRTRVRGLLLSGHSVLYPGLLGVTISAFYTCSELLGLKTLHQRVTSI